MIKVDVKKIDNLITEITVSGHADYQTKGQDLVCAGVSSIVIGGLNALNKSNLYKIEIKEGFVHLNIDNNVDNKDQIVLQTIITQLRTIEDTYPKNILITERKN